MFVFHVTYVSKPVVVLSSRKCENVWMVTFHVIAFWKALRTAIKTIKLLGLTCTRSQNDYMRVQKKPCWKTHNMRKGMTFIDIFTLEINLDYDFYCSMWARVRDTHTSAYQISWIKLLLWNPMWKYSNNRK